MGEKLSRHENIWKEIQKPGLSMGMSFL